MRISESEAEVVAGVEVTVEAGEVGRGDFEADAVAALEDVGRDADFDLVGLDGAGREQARLVLPMAVAGTEDSIAEVHGVAGG